MKLRIGFALLALAVASVVYSIFAALGLLIELEKGGNVTDDRLRIGGVSAGTIVFFVLVIRLTREYRETRGSTDENTHLRAGT